MSLTRAAQRVAAEAADSAILAIKDASRRKIERIKAAFDPPLSNAELSAGLGLRAPPPERSGASDIGRYLSDAPRNRRARPDTAVRALLDALLEGRLLLAVRPPPAPGARREVLICDASDVERLPRWWTIRNLAGTGVPERPNEDWDDDGLWDLFGDRPAPPPPPPKRVAVPGLVPVADVAPSAPGAPLPSLMARPDLRDLGGRRFGRLGLGCMRLSTAGRPDRADAIAVVHHALEHGVRLLDTADTYCLDQDDLHHNEALLVEAVASWDGPRDEVLIATKAGLARPKGGWVPNGRPKALRKAVEGSLAAMGLERLPLLQLHAPHGAGVPFADQVGALADLRDEGKIELVGLCNVTLEQLEEALDITPIASVQNRANRFDVTSFRNGVVTRCHALGIPFIAYAPVGGHSKRQRCHKDANVGAIASKHGVTPEQVVMAWLLGMGPGIIAIPGATRAGSIDANLAARSLRLDDADHALLGKRRPWIPTVRQEIAETDPGLPPEIVLVSGSPAAGKTSRVQPYLAEGYLRLNRDDAGGTLKKLDAALRARLDDGVQHVVMDNTYPTAASRAGAIEAGRAHGIPVRCVHIDIPPSEAYMNACLRMIERQGRLLTADEIKVASKADPNMFPPGAIFRYTQLAEPPREEEGFASVEVVPFVRRPSPERIHKALILDYDGTLRTSTGPAPFPLQPDDVELMPGRKEALDAFAAAGWLLLGVSNQSGVAGGQLSEEQARACFDRTNELLGHAIDVRFDTHPSGRIDNWTRKPMPGLGVQLILDHALDRTQCVYVGDQDTDRQFAENCGFRWAEASDFFDDLGWRFLLDG